MQRTKAQKGNNFTMLASANTASLQLVDQVAMCKEDIEYNLNVDLNRSSEGLCGYNDISTQLESIALKIGRVNGE
jgi:hypothetical protein